LSSHHVSFGDAGDLATVIIKGTAFRCRVRTASVFTPRHEFEDDSGLVQWFAGGSSVLTVEYEVLERLSLNALQEAEFEEVLAKAMPEPGTRKIDLD